MDFKRSLRLLEAYYKSYIVSSDQGEAIVRGETIAQGETIARGVLQIVRINNFGMVRDELRHYLLYGFIYWPS